MTSPQTRSELIFDLPMVRYTAQPDGQLTETWFEVLDCPHTPLWRAEPWVLAEYRKIRPVRWATCTASPVGPRFWTAGPRYPAVDRSIAAWRAW